MSLIPLGFATGTSLIAAIGPQNAFVLRQGIRREHVGVVVAICTAADLALIAVGTAGFGAVIAKAPALLDVLRWAGAAYLIWFALRSLRSALRPEALTATSGDGAPSALAQVARTTVALTFLNPHVYLDTVVMIGGLAGGHGDGRWSFAAGVALASVVWFATLGFGARALSRSLAKPLTWRIIDLVVAVVMVAVAIRLVRG